MMMTWVLGTPSASTRRRAAAASITDRASPDTIAVPSHSATLRRKRSQAYVCACALAAGTPREGCGAQEAIGGGLVVVDFASPLKASRVEDAIALELAR